MFPNNALAISRPKTRSRSCTVAQLYGSAGMVSVNALQCCDVTIHMVLAAVSSSRFEGFGFRSGPACGPSELHPSQQPGGSSRESLGQAICQAGAVFSKCWCFVCFQGIWVAISWCQLDQTPPTSVITWSVAQPGCLRATAR
jgi:hypothetical protein